MDLLNHLDYEAEEIYEKIGHESEEEEQNVEPMDQLRNSSINLENVDVLDNSRKLSINISEGPFEEENSLELDAEAIDNLDISAVLKEKLSTRAQTKLPAIVFDNISEDENELMNSEIENKVVPVTI